MCFSAQADLVAGVVVGGLAVDAFRHVRKPAQKLLVAVPVVLAVHQMIEALVWWGLNGHGPHAVWRTAVWLYLVIAFGIVPVLVPLAVEALEPAFNRRRIQGFAALGVAVAVVLLYALIRGPVVATIERHHIAYDVNLAYGGVIVTLYVLATCGSMLVSSHRHVRQFGGLNLIAAGLLAWLNKSGFISLWCVWAALTSLVIVLHLRHTAEPPRARARDTVS